MQLMWAEQLRVHDDIPVEDKIVVLYDVASDYQSSSPASI
jgi:hypothetical protein